VAVDDEAIVVDHVSKEFTMHYSRTLKQMPSLLTLAA
jgi:hypothetical protein